jgi:hypothetical protein
MPLTIRCACGKHLRADAALAGRRVRCPSCQTAFVVPAAAAADFASFAATPPPLTRPLGGTAGRWIAAGGVGVVALVVVLIVCLSGKSNEEKDESPPPKTPQVAGGPGTTPEPSVDTSRPEVTLEKAAVEEREVAVKKPLAPSPRGDGASSGGRVGRPRSEPPPVPAPAITRVQPEQPKAGETLVIDLKKAAPDAELQYRTDVKGAWQAAPSDRVVLVNLKAGKLTLEIRARVGEDRTSPVVRRSWAVKAVESQATSWDPSTDATWKDGIAVLKKVPPVLTDNRNALVKKYRARLRLTASSVWGGWPTSNALDGNIETSWFSAHGDAAALGRSPWLQANFPENVAVSRVTILGNRDPAWLTGYTILEGRLTVYGARGQVIRTVANKGVGNFRDFDYKFDPPLKGVRAIRFTSLKDQGNHTVHKDIGLAEFQVDGSTE